MGDAHTTDYRDTFIAVAEDCPAAAGTVPPARSNPSVADRTYRMISEHPYAFTSDEVIFAVWADRQGIAEAERPQVRADFFAAGRPCLRSSDLGKRYGWGIHADSDGRTAAYGVETSEYARLATGTGPSGEPLTVLRAMRSRR